MMKTKEAKVMLQMVHDNLSRSYDECAELMPEDAEKEFLERISIQGFITLPDGYTALVPLKDALDQLQEYIDMF